MPAQQSSNNKHLGDALTSCFDHFAARAVQNLDGSYNLAGGVGLEAKARQALTNR